MTPKQLEQLPASLSKLYMDLELDIMKEITLTISNVSKLEYTQYLIERAFVLGVGEKDLKSMINRTTRLTQKEVDSLVTNAIKIDYESLRELYNQKGIDYIPFKDNEILQQQIATIKAQTLGECKNITNTLGFASEKGGTVVFNDLTSFYQSTMDKVVLQVSTGAFDYTTAMTRAVKSMTQSGLRTIDYASGAKNKVEVATRRALMTGITQLSGQVSLSNANKLGIETFEVTAHGGARNTGSGYLNHAGWQGKVYTLKQLEEICGYGQGGGLKGWNCRHDFYPFDEEFSPRMYPDSELKELAEQENTKTEYKGEKYTTYEATQMQRKLETRMRYQRQNMELMESASLDSLQSEKVLYQRTKQEYIQFSKEMDMPTQFERVKVDGLGNLNFGSNVVAQKAKRTGEKYTQKQRIKAISGKENIQNELVGVKRGKEMNFSEANGMKANPKFAENVGYKTNCQSCVVSYEARRRGFDVQTLSMENNKTAEELAKKTNTAWIDPKTKLHPEYILDEGVKYTAKTYKAYLSDKIKQNERYTLEFGWRGRKSAHIIHVDRLDNGTLRLYDPQSGKQYLDKSVVTRRFTDKELEARQKILGRKKASLEISENEIDTYLERISYSSKILGSENITPPKILRVDNMQFNEEVCNGIMKGSD